MFSLDDDSEVHEYIQLGELSEWMSTRDNNDASKVYLIQGM